MKILITGLGGFIGTSISKHLTKKHDVYSFERTDSEIPTVKKVKGDLLDTQSVYGAIKSVKPECIILMGAISSIYHAERDRLKTYLTNTKSVEDIIRASIKLESEKPPLIIFFSTDLVFDGYALEKEKGFKESDPPKTKTIYGRSKLESEHLLHFYPNSLILRIAFTYGPPDSKERGYIASIKKSILQNETITFFKDEWRTPVFLDHIGIAIGKILNSNERPNKLLHIAGNERLSRVEFGKRLLMKEGYDYKNIAFTFRRDSEIGKKRGMDCSLNNALAKKLLGIKFEGS